MARQQEIQVTSCQLMTESRLRSNDEDSAVSSGLCPPTPGNSAFKKSVGTGTTNSLPKRKLHFVEFVKAIRIPHLNDMTQEEVDNVYMTSEEHENIRQECLGEVDAIGYEKISDGFLLRGLDQHTNRYKEAKSLVARQLYDAIFTVQAYGFENNIDVAELMASLSMKFSEPSAVAAQSAALSDIFSSFKDTWGHRRISSIPTEERETWSVDT